MLPKPPFDPPLNLLCQVLEFDSPEDAAAYASEPGSAAPQWAGLGWLPDNGLVVEATGADGQRITFQQAGQDVTVLVRHGTSDRYFYSVYLGQDAKTPPEAELGGILAAVAARIGATN